ncbi:MAG: hypothetical protein ACE5FA_06130 [Dehalococcoidia bacterium]
MNVLETTILENPETGVEAMLTPGNLLALVLVRDGRARLNDLSRRFDVSMDELKQAVRQMRRARLVKTKKSGGKLLVVRAPEWSVDDDTRRRFTEMLDALEKVADEQRSKENQTTTGVA